MCRHQGKVCRFPNMKGRLWSWTLAILGINIIILAILYDREKTVRTSKNLLSVDRYIVSIIDFSNLGCCSWNSNHLLVAD